MKPPSGLVKLCIPTAVSVSVVEGPLPPTSQKVTILAHTVPERTVGSAKGTLRVGPPLDEAVCHLTLSARTR